MQTLDQILVPVDFSACSRAALDYAAFLANGRDATIDVLHIWGPMQSAWDPPDAEQDPLVVFERTEAGNQMKKFLARLEDEGIGLQIRGRLESGDPCATILRVAAENDYDLIVMGTHGVHTDLTSLILESVAESVVRRAPCPVVTIRAPDPLLEAAAPRRWTLSERLSRELRR
jgi:universal stress protein A